MNAVLDNLTEDEEAQLTQAMEILEGVRESAGRYADIFISVFESQVRDRDAELLEMCAAFKEEGRWYTVSELCDATGLNREQVMQHMATLIGAREDVFERVAELPSEGMGRRGQGFHVRPGMIGAVEAMVEAGKRQAGELDDD